MSDFATQIQRLWPGEKTSFILWCHEQGQIPNLFVLGLWQEIRAIEKVKDRTCKTCNREFTTVQGLGLHIHHGCKGADQP